MWGAGAKCGTLMGRVGLWTLYLTLWATNRELYLTSPPRSMQSKEEAIYISRPPATLVRFPTNSDVEPS
ncbi:hypothetical protein VTH06DRAFT_25 [Thermothelomyces fergusii]